MKSYYNQSDLNLNMFTKIHQNPTYGYRDIGFNIRTDSQIRGAEESKERDR